MSDMQRAAALGVVVVLGGLALIGWASGQDNPYTSASETPGGVVFLGAAVAAAGVLATIGALIALALGVRDLPGRVKRR